MIIGLCGKKYSGKDTVGQYLVDNYGYERAAFADLLKQSVAALFGITREEVDEWKDESKAIYVTVSPDYDYTSMVASMTWREFLQRYGTESHREVFGSNFWVQQLTNQTYKFKDNTVFTDVRFNEEVDYIKAIGGKMLWVDRPSVRDDSDTHASEILPYEGQIEFPRIPNTDTIEQLYSRVDNLMERIHDSERFELGG